MGLLTNIATPFFSYIEDYFSQCMKEEFISNKYSWIPTNLGILNFNYLLFSKEKLKKFFPNSTFRLYSTDNYPKNLNIYGLSIDDFVLPESFKILKSFFNFNFEIKIKKDENNNLIGKVVLQNSDNSKYKSLLNIFRKFFKVNLEYKNYLIYLSSDFIINKNHKFLIPKVKNNTKGYITYINTFFHLFKDEVENKKDFNTLFTNIHNVKESLDASVDRYLDKKNSNKGLITFFITLMAIFLSFNIAYNSFDINYTTSLFISELENLNNNIAKFLNILTGSIFDKNRVLGRDIFIIILLIISTLFAYIYDKERTNHYIENIKKNYFSSLTEYSRFNKSVKYKLGTFISLMLIFLGIYLFL